MFISRNLPACWISAEGTKGSWLMKEEINILSFNVLILLKKDACRRLGKETTNCEDLDNLSKDIILQ